MNYKSITCLALFIIWFTISDCALAAEPIILRTSVTPVTPWLGQKVIMHVDVLAKDGWAQIKKVGDVEVPGAYLLRLETQGTRLSETIEGDSFTGQRYEFMLFAQRAGTLTVPSVPVDVEVKTWGAGGGTGIHRMSTPSVEFLARTPPGAEGIRGLISTADLTANQYWEPETEDPMVGDALKRTITLRAKDVSGMAFAPISHNRIEDLGIYPGEPEIDDRFARGDLTGTRVETVTYVFERAGAFEIPDLELSWWDVGAGELKQLVLPGLSLQVTGNAVAEPDPVEPSLQKTSWSQWSALIVVLIATVVALRFGRRAANHWVAWRKARSEREVVYFRRIAQSARLGDERAVLRETMRWLDRINDDSRPARLDQFLQKYGEAQAQENVSELISVLAAARKRWQRAQRRTGQVTGLLPGFNGMSE
jgi:hypothetical protein